MFRVQGVQVLLPGLPESRVEARTQTLLPDPQSSVGILLVPDAAHTQTDAGNRQERRLRALI